MPPVRPHATLPKALDDFCQLRGYTPSYVEVTMGATMSPDTQAAIKSGRPLTRRQFREFIDHEARAAGFKDADDAITLFRQGRRANTPREASLRMSINTFLHT